MRRTRMVETTRLQNRQDAEIAKGEAITRRCANQQNEYKTWKGQRGTQKKTIGKTTNLENR